ncbi:MAG: tRNA (adenosine(37)-N6)-threonylcarbamoyltransferase complex transferase subunit TsaD [Bdellovibrionales bacterium]
MKSSKEFVLGIETSCDDTSVALVKSSGEVLALKKWTNDEDHIPFGGIIPERASRNHLKNLVPLIDKILEENGVGGESLKGIAVTNRPGLQGSLIVGVLTAQTLGALLNVPVVGVNHLEGHMQSPWLVDQGEEVREDVYPQMSLIVSGGHTQLVYIEKFGSYKILGRTKDDAVGEAIDKFSNVIGLGFPGGPKVDKAAQSGKSDAYAFPRPMIREQSYDFSFSGLKAAGVRLVEKMLEDKSLSKEQVNDLSASYLTSAVDVLIYKLEKALAEYQPKVFSIVGGVSANSMLRQRALELSKRVETPLLTAEMKYCTDNGAMIALAGAKRLDLNLEVSDKFETYARSLPGDFS